MRNGADRPAPGARSLGRRLVSRRWRYVTLLVIAGMLVLGRLGIWQLDRRQERRAANAVTAAQLAAAPLPLTGAAADADLLAAHNRPVAARGEYDLAAQFALLSQNYEGQPGIYLITPLRLEDSPRAVLVNRGWLPAAEAEPAAWAAYDLSGPVAVTGYLQVARLPARLSPADYDNSPDNPSTGWFYLYVDAIQQQFTYDLLPVTILATGGSGVSDRPVPLAPDIDLSEGPHLSYASQWFIFALMLGGGYAYFVRRQESA